MKIINIITKLAEMYNYDGNTIFKALMKNCMSGGFYRKKNAVVISYNL